MAEPTIDFGTGTNRNEPIPASNQDGSNITPLDGVNDVEDINANKGGNIPPAAGTETVPPAVTPPAGDQNDEAATDDLTEGTIVAFDGVDYTVNKDGALVDSKGVVFKTADETKTLLAESNIIGDNELNIDNVRSAIGIDIVGEDGKPVAFDNTTEGISNYVNSVIALKSSDIEKAAVQSLFDTYPVVQDFINHLAANGGDYKTFGQTPDRTGISIDKDNAAQQESIIRESFKEFGKGDPEGYIKYLKDSGSLFDEATRELAALQKVDGDRKANVVAQAAAAQAKAEADDKAYWASIKASIDSKKIAGYQIPETIIINKDGKQTAATPTDFYNYLYATDKDGYSAYAKEASNVKPEDAMQDELLRAYLKFTGGSYKDLVNIAINNQEVKRLRVESNKGSRRNITITKPNGGRTDLSGVKLS